MHKPPGYVEAPVLKLKRALMQAAVAHEALREVWARAAEAELADQHARQEADEQAAAKAAQRVLEAEQAAAEAAAELLQEEAEAAEAAQRLKQKAAAKKERQRQRKQVQLHPAVCQLSLELLQCSWHSWQMPKHLSHGHSSAHSQYMLGIL